MRICRGSETAMDADDTAAIRERVHAAQARGEPLRILGGGSKQFYGREVPGEPLAVGAHRGITDYDAAELVLTARAGTPLAEIEAALAANGQCLPFEPPHFGAAATVGGTIACGIAGPARAYAGAVKDYVLGVVLMNAAGQCLRFGGQVMKNVAGYDVARATVGSLGSLGVLLECSLKVLPRAPQTTTRLFELDAGPALQRMNEWARSPSCISATAWVSGRLHVRLSGSEAAIASAAERMGGESQHDDAEFWMSIREHTHGFFRGAEHVLRVAVPALCAPQRLPGECLMEWGGAQRWFVLRGETDALATAAHAAGGFATRFRGGERGGAVFPPVPAAQMRLQRSLKAVFDPRAIFNRGRLHAEL